MEGDGWAALREGINTGKEERETHVKINIIIVIFKCLSFTSVACTAEQK